MHIGLCGVGESNSVVHMRTFMFYTQATFLLLFRRKTHEGISHAAVAAATSLLMPLFKDVFKEKQYSMYQRLHSSINSFCAAYPAAPGLRKTLMDLIIHLHSSATSILNDLRSSFDNLTSPRADEAAVLLSTCSTYMYLLQRST